MTDTLDILMNSPKHVITHTITVRPDLEIEINDGENGPHIYLAGVRHNVGTVEEYMNALSEVIVQLMEWYPDWTGWNYAQMG